MDQIVQPLYCINCPYKSVIFSDLSDDELAKVEQSKQELFFRKGDTILSEGEEVKQFIYLTGGLAKIHKRESEKSDQIIGISIPFDFIGFLFTFSGEKSNYSYTAIEDSRACIIPVGIIKSNILKNGSFAMKMIESMSKTADKIIDTRFKLNKKHLRGRIAYILLFFAYEIYKNDRFNLPVSRKEIAELINMTTENVIRILSEFRQDKIIEIDGKTITIINKEILIKICELG